MVIMCQTNKSYRYTPTNPIASKYKFLSTPGSNFLRTAAIIVSIISTTEDFVPNFISYHYINVSSARNDTSAGSSNVFALKLGH
jgi:hypothetical protein